MLYKLTTYLQIFMSGVVSSNAAEDLWLSVEIDLHRVEVPWRSEKYCGAEAGTKHKLDRKMLFLMAGISHEKLSRILF